MGRRLRTQKRGKGSRVYRSVSKNLLERITYKELKEQSKDKQLVVEIMIHAPRLSIRAIKIGKKYLVARKGAYTGQRILIDNEKIDEGALNITKLKYLSEGTVVCQIEKTIDKGRSFLLAAGAKGIITNKNKEEVTVKFIISKFEKKFHPEVRAMVGEVSGAGKVLKRMLKAGTNTHRHRHRVRKTVHVRGVAMNAVDHPFGGGSKQAIGKPSTVRYGISPGKKVGRLSKKRKRLKKYYK